VVPRTFFGLILQARAWNCPPRKPSGDAFDLDSFPLSLPIGFSMPGPFFSLFLELRSGRAVVFASRWLGEFSRTILGKRVAPVILLLRIDFRRL